MGNFMSFSTVKAPDEDSNYAGRTPIPFGSKEEMILWLKDPRYRRGEDGAIDQRDRSYIAHCEARLGLTDDNITGVGRDISGAEHTPEFQDLNGDLSKLTDTYHSVEESQADMRSTRYKTDPYFREIVAQKISRSVPDEAAHGGKQTHSVQAGGVEDGEGE